MWLGDMFKGLTGISRECNAQFAPPPGAPDAIVKQMSTGANLCTSARSEEAQVAMQAIATGIVIGVLAGHFLWKRS